MSNKISHSDVMNITMTKKQVLSESYNCKVAMWHLPYDEKLLKYDKDGTRWFEAINQNMEDEIEDVEKNLHINLNKYKVYIKESKYDDKTFVETSQYPNGNRVEVTRGRNHVFVNVKDKDNNLVAEKQYNYDSNDGRKILYKHCKKGENIFTVVRIFSYDTTKNRSTDVVNYGYTSFDSKLTDGCVLEKEYYMLNGKEVKANKISESEYSTTNKQGQILTFSVE